MKKILIAAGFIAGAFAAAPASALPSTKITGAEAGPRAETVAWYCNKKGHCVQAPRGGYVVRQGWAPTCVGNFYWDGYRCATRVVVVKPAKPIVVVRPIKPVVKVKIK